MLGLLQTTAWAAVVALVSMMLLVAVMLLVAMMLLVAQRGQLIGGQRAGRSASRAGSDIRN